jgi:hypothetical protein
MVTKKFVMSKQLLHLRSFKTPPLGAVMSEEDDADCAFSMRKGVKVAGFIIAYSYLREGSAFRMCNGEKRRFSQHK